MREKLEELRRELQIPHSDDSDDEFVGMTTMRPISPDDRSTVYSNADRLMVEEEFSKNAHVSHGKHRRNTRTDPMMTTQKINFPTLKQQQGRPPLPKSKPRSRTASGSSIATTGIEQQNCASDLLRQGIEEENGLEYDMDKNRNGNVENNSDEEIQEDKLDRSANSKRSSLLSTAQEGLDPVESDPVETPHLSSRFSSDVTVTPRGETTDSGRGLATVTPIHESEEDGESLLDEPQSVTKDTESIQRRLSEQIGSQLSLLQGSASKVDEYVPGNTEVEYEEDPLDLYRQTLQTQQDHEYDDTIVGDDEDSTIDEESGRSHGPSAPTPTKRTPHTLTHVSKMVGSQLITSSDADDDVISTSSMTRPTPRKRSTIASSLCQLDITPRTDTRKTDESESIEVSETDFADRVEDGF